VAGGGDRHRSGQNSHGRREIRTLKVVTIAAGIVFPHAAQALQFRRRTRPLSGRGRWHTETVYAITDLHAHQARPEELTAWIRDVTFGEDHSQVRTGAGPQVMATFRNLVISLNRLNGEVNIAAALRHHARDTTRPLTLLKIT
jgi:hypothetical protein